MRMIEIGKMFPDANITWIQIRQYDFGFGPAKIPGQWRDFRVDKVDYEGRVFESRSTNKKGPFKRKMLLFLLFPI